MEERHEPASAVEPSSPAGLRGLVVQSGRGAGTWQPLRSPVTLVGRSPACDVRIDSAGVRALHCLLAPGPDGVSLRAVHAGGVKVNGRAANAAVLRDGDVIAIGPSQFRVRWPALIPTHDPALEALRIQAAAVVAQQAALFEEELALGERETALRHQEGQLAEHLDDKRRQLLDLQDQITEARENLRQKRAAHEALADEQNRALAATRDEAAELLVHAKSDRQRLIALTRKLRARWRRERKSHRESVRTERAKLDAAQTELQRERSQFADISGRRAAEIELDKRRLRDAWERLTSERKGWAAQRAGQETDLRRKLRDVLQREKAVHASEARLAAERQQVDSDLESRRRECDHLETRILHARERLLELSAPAPEPARTDSPRPEPIVDVTPDEASELRTKRLAQIALDLSDQRLWLAEQLARMRQARADWNEERERSGTELQKLAVSLTAQEGALSGRARDLTAAEQRIQTECDALTQMRLRQEAERTRGEAQLAHRAAEMKRRSIELAERADALDRREQKLSETLKTWGRRRRQAIDGLATATAASRDERAEWAVARSQWLHELDKITEERRDLAARSLALEQARTEWVEDAERTPAALKRLDRLERQWNTQCAVALRDLLRLRLTLETESARLDQASEESRIERLQAKTALADAEDRLAQAHALQVLAESERELADESADRERTDRAIAEDQVAELRDEVESLARLFIDAPRAIDRAA